MVLNDFTPFIELVSAPSALPVSFNEAAEHIYLDDTTQQAYVESLITVATNYVQSQLNRQLVTATYRQIQPTLSEVNPIQIGPVLAITSLMRNKANISEVDSVFTAETYSLQRDRLIMNGRSYIDSAGGIDYQYEITFTAGYGTASQVPQELKHAILLLVADLYENRQIHIDKTANRLDTIDRLIAKYRRWQ